MRGIQVRRIVRPVGIGTISSSARIVTGVYQDPHQAGWRTLTLIFTPLGCRLLLRLLKQAAKARGTQAASAEDLARTIEQARSAFDAGRLDEAETLCMQGLARAAADPRLLVLHGRIATRRGAVEPALQSFQAAYRASDSDPATGAFLAAGLHRAGRTGEAKDLAIRIARGLGPEQSALRQQLASLVDAEFGDDHAAASIAVLDDTFQALMPVRIRIESASACNLRCQHCPTGVRYDATERTIMKRDLFERVLEQMKQLPSLRDCVLYLGGEPLMNRRLVEMCQRVKAETSVTRTFITTNGMLLSEKACAGLASARLDQIFVSVDGRSPQENDAIRVRAKYQTIVDNVARLRRHLEGTATQVVISHAMVRAADDPDQPQTPQFLKRDFPGLHIWSDYATRWPGFDLAQSRLSDSLLAVGQQRNFCGFPFFELAVRVTGEVVLCCHDLLGESVMGNIWQSDLADIWNGPAYRELRRHMLARNAAGVHEVCRRCFIFTGERIERGTSYVKEGVPS